MRIRTEAAWILKERKVNPEGKELDTQRLGRTNLIVIKAAIDREVNKAVGRKKGERHAFTRDELEKIDSDFSTLVEQATKDIFHG